jgi:hypothetical protein
VKNLWAYYRWERVPCKVRTDGLFIFKYGDRAYTNQKRDMWDRRDYRPELTIDPGPTPSICYVAPDMKDAVLYLDAHKRLDRALPALIPVALASCVAFIITYVSRRAARKRSSPEAAAPITPEH